jgi:hypothetical protein
LSIMNSKRSLFTNLSPFDVDEIDICEILDVLISVLMMIRKNIPHSEL